MTLTRQKLLREELSAHESRLRGRISGEDEEDDPPLSLSLSLSPTPSAIPNLEDPEAMLGKRPRSVIGKLSELLVSGSAGLLESAVAAAAAASPRSPLDFKIQSPRGPRSYDLGGVGLGIVAALEKPGDAKILLLSKSCAGGSGSARPGQNGGGSSSAGACTGADDDMEDYTYVTFHGPNQSFTMVYYGEGECDGVGRGGCGGSGGLGGTMRRAGSVGEGGGGPVFQALDLYMYRDETAFCSAECRSTQMMMDERKEQCRSEAPRVADHSGSPYSEGQIFPNSILAI